MSGGGGERTTTSSIDPRFSPIIDYATQAAGRVNNAGFQPYQGQRFEGLNATQNAGLDMIQNRAIGGDPTMRQANSTIQGVLGDGGGVKAGTNAYAGANPYLESAIEKAQLGTAGNLAKINATSGSFGNSGIQEVGARQMGEIASNMRMQDYGMQQQLAESGLNRDMQAQQINAGNKLNALQIAPTYGNQAYTDASQLMKVGGQMQDQGQQVKDFSYQQFQDQQNAPYKQMGAFGGLLSGQPTKNTVSTGGGK
jgi:hypothetical protein